jgi:hypothetical protein
LSNKTVPVSRPELKQSKLLGMITENRSKTFKFPWILIIALIY